MKFNCTKMILPVTLAVLISQSVYAGSTVTVRPDGKNNGLKDKKVISPVVNVEDRVARNEQGVREIDLTNEKHKELVFDRLNRAGITADKFPQLYLNKETQLEQQLMAKSFPLESMTAMAVPGTIDELDIIKNAQFFLDLNVAISEDNNKPYLFVRAKSSVYGGTDSTYIDLMLEDTSGRQLSSIGSALSVQDGKDTVVITGVPLTTLKANFPNLETIIASSYVETEIGGVIKSAIKYTEYPFDWAHFERLYGPQGPVAKNTLMTTDSFTLGDDDPGKPAYEAIHPVDGNGGKPKDGVIKVCLNRAHADCDYEADQYREPNEITDVNIPFEGQLVIPHEVTEIVPSDQTTSTNDEPTNIYLQEGVYGGATKQSFKGLDNELKLFSEYVTFRVDAVAKTTTISWNIPRAEGRFGNAKLFSNIAEANWYLLFNLKGKPFFRGRAGNFQVAVTSEAAARFWTYYSPVLPKMKLGYSCLAKGTGILMADGSLAAIENIQLGDLVTGALAKNAYTAQPMSVVDVSVGVEALEMFRVISSDGKNILMTETHPVSTSNKGIIWAKELEEGDRILTADGSSLVTSISTEAYRDNIYNLKLAPLADSAIEEGADLGMFANGLLVGDLATQDEYNYKDQFGMDSPEEVLQRIPEKWKTDYLNSLNLN